MFQRKEKILKYLMKCYLKFDEEWVERGHELLVFFDVLVDSFDDFHQILRRKVLRERNVEVLGDLPRVAVLLEVQVDRVAASKSMPDPRREHSPFFRLEDLVQLPLVVQRQFVAKRRRRNLQVSVENNHKENC